MRSERVSEKWRKKAKRKRNKIKSKRRKKYYPEYIIKLLCVCYVEDRDCMLVLILTTLKFFFGHIYFSFFLPIFLNHRFGRTTIPRPAHTYFKMSKWLCVDCPIFVCECLCLLIHLYNISFSFSDFDYNRASARIACQHSMFQYFLPVDDVREEEEEKNLRKF